MQFATFVNVIQQLCVHLGMFSLRKKIEDAVLRGEMLAPTVLHLEEEMHVWREEEMRDYNLWDDPVKSNEMLAKLADHAKVVDTLKDLAFKVMINLLFFNLN